MRSAPGHPSEPTPHVLAAFGVAGPSEPVPGGHGLTWRSGDLVFKPLDMLPEELDWQAALYERIEPVGFRVAPPVRAENGALAVDGWTATAVVEGRHEPGRWPEIVEVAERFHRALADVERPPLIDRRTHQWAVADHVCWGERPWQEFAHVRHVERLASALRPVDLPSQLVHNDLCGNVLFADTLTPAVIDLAAYWRPPGYATATVIADALIWEGAEKSLLDYVSAVASFPQLFLRSVLFRVVCDRRVWEGSPPRTDDEDPFLPVVELALRLASG